MTFFLFFLFFTPLFASSQEINPKGLDASHIEETSSSSEGQAFLIPTYKGWKALGASSDEYRRLDSRFRGNNDYTVTTDYIGMTDYARVTSEFLNRISISEGELNKADQTKHSIAVHLDSEGQLSKNKISKNQKELYPHVPYTEFGFAYSKNDNLNFFVNLTTEFDKNEWQIGVGEFSLSYDFEDVPLSVKAGWFSLPLGYMDQNSKVFSQDLSLYEVLIQNQKDMGFVTNVHIWKEFLILQGSVFGGWSYRESDNSYKAPDSIPFIVSVKSRGLFWDAFISWFEKDPAFLDPLQALGVGVELKTSYKKLTVSVQSEWWQVMEKKQTTFAYYVFPKLSIHKFQAGMVFGDINRFSPAFKTAQVKSSIYEKVLQLSFQIHPNILLIGERFISKQRKGLLANDSWAARVKVHFDWSKDF